MNARIWNVKFGSYTHINVMANNVSQAIKNARKERKINEDTYLNRIQDITEVNLLAETG